MRTNESEYKRLEVAIHDLKTENNRLQEALDQVIEDRDSYHDENAELRKDKARLDWLVDNTAISMFRKDEDGEEWWVELDYSEARNDIDKEMEDETNNHQNLFQITNYDKAAERVNAAQIELENEELQKDKERLDWVLSHEGHYWLSFREDIDKEMKRTQ